MLRRLSLGLLASAISIASLPAIAQEEGSADDLGVMSISLKDVVKPTFGFQGALQGAGTPNQAGIGGFLPLSVGDNSVWFVDVLANVNFADRAGESSIINTDVDGATISTSTRVGYRWLNGDRSWMFGLNAGYDTRPIATGAADSGVSLFGSEKTVFFQQAAVNLEAVSNDWDFNAYGLIPTGEKVQQINWLYQAGSLATYGIDAGYNITPAFTASVGYYYQDGDGSEADGSGVLGRLGYEITNGLIAGFNISYDEAFETKVSADIVYRFGGPSKTNDKKKVAKTHTIKALFRSPSNRNVRIHDAIDIDKAVAIKLAGVCLADQLGADYKTAILASTLLDKTAENKTVGNYLRSLDDSSDTALQILERLDTTVFQTNQLGFKAPASGDNPAGVAIIDRYKWQDCVDDGMQNLELKKQFGNNNVVVKG
ncbi:carbamoyl-phosphate synthase [Synechococcus sp. MIT S9503]|uniref:carbamoyl-phosphate synthase n=1 Tax=Synechococcus sp. MIT S9503 TaxID=3082547 RepID=UPI0039A44325